METLILMVGCGAAYLVAYHTYGKFIARKIFNLMPENPVPSHEMNDGIDYVPTKKGIIFGHHYTSIAGTGPIVGPAIGVIFGWLPAILWVVFGAIFMGAVHDFGALVVSLRNEGKSISEIAARYINKRVRFIFFAVVFLTVMIVIAIFGVVIASIFTNFPESVLPVWLQIPIAVLLGYAVYKKSKNITLSTFVAVAAMYTTIFFSGWLETVRPGLFLISSDIPWLPPATGTWTILLLIYAWIASTLSVTTLLQPRDYINAWQLFIAMTLLALGVITASFNGDLSFAAPAVNHKLPAGTPSLWPFLFVIIACGAISGFHSLVSSGTSPKQISKENDAQFVGYGSMLMEGFLAVLVIICIIAGLGIKVDLADGGLLKGTAAWQNYYSEWIGAKGLSNKLAPVVIGASNIMGSIGIPEAVGLTIMGVFIASFAGTTLDTSVRIQRYVVSELASDLKIKALTNRWTATSFAVVTAAALAFGAGADGTGAMKLWPLFGTANQLLAALALFVVTAYLKKKGGLKFLISGLPCLIMLIITNWAMVENQISFIKQKNYLLITVGSGIFILALWMTIESIISIFTARPEGRPR